MDLVLLLVVLASIIFAILIGVLVRRQPWIVKFSTYPFPHPIPYSPLWLSRITWPQAVLVVLYIVANTGLTAIPSQKGNLTIFILVNLAPVLLGGRTNPIADYLGVPLHVYYLVHHWAGRVVLAPGIAHLVDTWSRADTSQRISGGCLIGFIAAICATSILPARKSIAFPYIHWLLFWVILGSLVSHVYFASPSLRSVGWFVLYGVALFRAAALVWRLRYRRGVFQVLKAETLGQVTRVRVRGVSVPAVPGSYFYVYMPHLPLIRRYHGTLAPLSWWKPGDRNTVEEFVLLLDRTDAAGLQKLRLDGPYGKKIDYDRYETVMLVADGIGIAGVLSFAISLVSRLKHDRED
jgi:hypothetical protein